MMKRFLVSVFVVAVLLSAPLAAAEDFDPSGTYNFDLSGTVVTGPCPMGKDGKGQLTIEKSGDGYVIKYLKGMVCNPPNVCVLTGSCKGRECKFSTTVPVDNEGGKVTNTAHLTFIMNHAEGTGGCVYQHPKMRCAWDYALTLTKPE
jgi:hypothetical protein